MRVVWLVVLSCRKKFGLVVLGAAEDPVADLAELLVGGGVVVGGHALADGGRGAGELLDEIGIVRIAGNDARAAGGFEGLGVDELLVGWRHQAQSGSGVSARMAGAELTAAGKDCLLDLGEG